VPVRIAIVLLCFGLVTCSHSKPEPDPVHPIGEKTWLIDGRPFSTPLPNPTKVVIPQAYGSNELAPRLAEYLTTQTQSVEVVAAESLADVRLQLQVDEGPIGTHVVSGTELWWSAQISARTGGGFFELQGVLPAGTDPIPFIARAVVETLQRMRVSTPKSGT